MAKFETGPTKAVQCSVCNKKFSRTDHLKRHQLRHSGVKPYACIFCKDAFTRSDNLRDHYPSCSQRKNRQIPEAARGGRRSHACDSCTSMKLGCDGNNPCKTCRHKKIECKFSRLQSKGILNRQETPKLDSDSTPTSDRGSINFLLNSGTASFIDCFRFPSSHENKNLFNFRNNQKSPESSDVVDMFGNNSDNGSAFSDFFEDESIDWSLFEEENLLKFLSTPVAEIHNFGSAPVMTNMPLPVEWEPASVQSAAIIQGVMESTQALHFNIQEQTQISQNLNFFFTPSKIDKFVAHYFEFWHPHCPILHQPSISIHTTPIPLLAAMIIMGSMFSSDDRDVNLGKVLLDLVEHYVYSIDDLTEESEVRQMFRASNPAPEMLPMSMLAFQHLQATYIIVCVQFWAGSLVARRRAADARFAVVVKMARRFGLAKVRHELDDSIDEHSWVLKEGRIRFINTITLLDCAFLFFANFPMRISFSEMNFELPCEEQLWASSHPFAEKNFTANRNVTLFEAFQSLFGQIKPEHAPVQATKGNPFALNPMDMFTLIHLIYVNAHTQITQYPSSFPRSPSDSGTSTPANHPEPLPDSNITMIKGALSRWRSLWINIRACITSNSWDKIGFFRNGFNYWLVIQLLINNKGSADILMGMEVGCEDALKQLRGLLRDGGGET
ncbi:uncharacterized protein LY89DRAFT_736502 [Mollisia scopiformis]|uniref:Uncharacterized protein n=1 Tax=Mollisia scopiformis TaxID=149040 RepID=A0A194X2R2_MOLSC|nr:uncharacterized protein LY89DRAFT_736502 [Mollisia scopiformis]KUJ14468.1 hypothetical protein LY89DRAFT_736502 [Mollisia scopiformis]